jgi:hypothetical protein
MRRLLMFPPSALALALAACRLASTLFPAAPGRPSPTLPAVPAFTSPPTCTSPAAPAPALPRASGVATIRPGAGGGWSACSGNTWALRLRR